MWMKVDAFNKPHKTITFFFSKTAWLEWLRCVACRCHIPPRTILRQAPTDGRWLPIKLLFSTGPLRARTPQTPPSMPTSSLASKTTRLVLLALDGLAQPALHQSIVQSWSSGLVRMPSRDRWTVSFLQDPDLSPNLLPVAVVVAKSQKPNLKNLNQLGAWFSIFDSLRCGLQGSP